MPNFYDSCESRFVWKIENFNCLKNESCFSPPVPFKTGGSTFNIVITLNNSYIFAHLSNYLRWDAGYCCSFSLLDANDTPLICKEKMTTGVAFEKDAFKFPKKAKFYPNNILRLELHLWWITYSNYTPLSIFACTHLVPIIKTVSKKFTCIIPEIKESASSFSETICEGQNLEIKVILPFTGQIYVQLTTQLFGFSASIIIWLLDSAGNRIEFGNHVAKFESGSRTCQFDLDVSRNMLMCHKNKFLMPGGISFRFSCTFTGYFHSDSMVEESNIFDNNISNHSYLTEVSDSERNLNDSEDVSAEETENDSREPQVIPTNRPRTASQALEKMLKEGYLSDFTIKVGNRSFSAHKAILGARSEFFRAMFDSEMKETLDNCMDIKEFAGDTIKRLLEFVYSDTIDGNMDSIEASSLYSAADFYGLEPLKQGCSTILKDSLTATNALGVLSLADSHQDHQLKSSVLDFVLRQDQDIIDSEAWVKFKENNPKLAMEAIEKLYVRKMKG